MRNKNYSFLEKENPNDRILEEKNESEQFVLKKE